MGDVPSDRRRAERVDVNTGFRGFGDGIYVSNLSEYGLFVQSNHLLALGTDIELQFTVVLDDPIVLRGRGKIVRHQTDPVGMGVEFTDLDPEMILRINDVITRERPRDLGPPLALGNVRSSGDETSDTTVQPIRDVVLRTANLRMAPLGQSSLVDDPEAAQTLMNLRPVDVEIIEDDDDLPQDDGGPLMPTEGR